MRKRKERSACGLLAIRIVMRWLEEPRVVSQLIKLSEVTVL